MGAAEKRAHYLSGLQHRYAGAGREAAARLFAYSVRTGRCGEAANARRHVHRLLLYLGKVQTDGLAGKNILAKKGWFSPPFQTEDELRAILQSLYRETDVHTDGSMVYFRCMK